jgi:uncharacterized damage-inducible protein DinB
MERSVSMNRSAAECAGVLRQGLALVERIDDRLYAEGLPEAPRGAVGAHVRHCLDFYRSFLAGLAAGRIDYNLRARDARVERDRAHASAALQGVICELEGLPDELSDADVLVAPEDSEEGVGGESAWCRSTAGRELRFLLSHTVHHFALVALALRLRGFEPGAEFGVNSSTLRHWRREREEQPTCAR